MSEQAIEKNSFEERRTKAMVIGGLVGAAVGVGAAYLFVQQAEISGKEPDVSAGEGVRIGLLVLGLLRQIAALGEGEGDKKKKK